MCTKEENINCCIKSMYLLYLTWIVCSLLFLSLSLVFFIIITQKASSIRSFSMFVCANENTQNDTILFTKKNFKAPGLNFGSAAVFLRIKVALFSYKAVNYYFFSYCFFNANTFSPTGPYFPTSKTPKNIMFFRYR